MASAAAAKKWPRPSQGFFGSSPTSLQVRLVNQGGGFERLPRLLVGHFLGRQLAQLVVDQRQELAGSARLRPCSIAERMRVTSDILINLLAYWDSSELLCFFALPVPRIALVRRRASTPSLLG